MKKIFLYIALTSICVTFGQTDTENYIQTISYKTEYEGSYSNFNQNLQSGDLLFNGAGGASGSVTITNNVLDISFGGSWSSSANRLKLGIIKTLNSSPILPNMELGDVVSSGNPTGYQLKISNGKLVMYSRYFLDGISTNISNTIPGGSSINYSTSLGTIYSCPSGGGGGGSGSISITNGVVTLDIGGGWSETCELKLGQIKYLSTSSIPNTEIGRLISNLHTETAYKAKIENNWLVFYSDETIPPLPSSGNISKAIDFNVSAEHKIETISYFDGLGRIKQKVDIMAGGQNEKIITPFDYDQHGRQVKEYLPYAINSTNSNFQINVIEGVQDFYNTSKYENTTNPYNEVQFENAPVNRILKQASPGNDWKMGNGHEIKFDYQTNDFKEVRKFEITFANGNPETPQLSANTNSYYGPNELLKTITYNENHPGTSTKNYTSEQFKDKHDRIILKRIYSDTDLNNDGILESEVPHDTYYVYDYFGNLTYVISPKVNITDGISNNDLNELCYQYKYDERNRLIEKKIPGKDWEYIIYNKLDQPIMTQDGNQRANNEWLFTVYDIFGRIAYTGIDKNNTSSRTEIQTAANNASKHFVTRTEEANTYLGTVIYYSKDAYPVSFDQVLTVNYYDDYEVGNIVAFNPAIDSGTWEGMTAVPNVKGLPTVAQVRVLDTNQWVTTATYYDQKGRAWETHVHNEYLRTDDWVLNKLDFSGNILKTRSRHQKGNNPVIVTVDNFTYDQMNRLLTHRQCIGDDSLSDSCGDVDPTLPENSVLAESITITTNETASSSITLSPGFHMVATSDKNFSAVIEQADGEMIIYNIYDELGKLTSKKVGNKQDTPLQTVDYTYNIRGWLNQINNPSSLGSDMFAFNINYNNTTENLNAQPLYNGNISETIWKTASDNIKRSYGYQYDALNRITSGLDNTADKRYSLSSIMYDKNGNITSLERKGQINKDATSFGIMDNLVYTYDSGNKLLKVTDNGNDNEGFKDYNTYGNDYRYDANGNIVMDLNKGIGSTDTDGVSYNFLNLPTNVVISNGSQNGNIEYIYDANGVKLVKIVTEGSSVTTTEYSGSYIYENNVLQFMNHAEGYTEPYGSDGYKYIYQYKDHLGNIRLSYADDNKDGIINSSTEIREEKNYYPFGLQHKGYNNTINGAYHPYGFINKEKNDEFGLHWLDFGARNYSPDLGRWMNLDPLAETMPEYSPYIYAFNNPIYFLDPDGERPCTNGDCGGAVVAIFFHGGPFGGGKTTTADKAGGTGKFYNSTQRAAQNSGREFKGTIIAPGLTSASGVDTALEFINENFSSGDQVIIYGYSYGVDVAVELAEALKEAGIDVDLLVTVDGSDGPIQNTTVNTNIPDNVDTNLNVYQDDDSGNSNASPGFVSGSASGSSSGPPGSASGSSSGSSSGTSSGSSGSSSGSSNSPGSNGGPNSAVNSDKTNVINKNISGKGVTHGNIQDKAKNIIQPLINTRIFNYLF